MWSSPRSISTHLLNGSLHLHIVPINLVVFKGILPDQISGISYLWVGFTLRCFQRLSDPYIVAQLCSLAEQLVHQWYVHPGPLVLRTAPFKFPAPATDRDRTVSRRSEPSSRTALIGEQPNPWDRNTAPGCDEPTSRCQTSPSMWTLGGDQPVIPRVTFIR